MSSIAGYWHFNASRFRADPIEAMTQTLAHRGPDGSGVMRFPDIGLAIGHRRLKVLDLSDRGRQPMCDPGEVVWLCFNGEIYNYKNERKRLAGKGWNFRSDTDKEVVLAAYFLEGQEFLRRLNGDFAFSIYDSRTNGLLLFRDRTGNKPLYYAIDKGLFAFSSEIKSFFLHPDIHCSINMTQMREYMANLCITGKNTLFDGIYEVEPGQQLRVRPGIVETASWYDFHYMPEVREMSATEQEKRVLELLDDSISLRMEANVPVGAYLSGGIGSSLMASRIALMSSDPPLTCTLGFGQGKDDELANAKRVAEKYNTNHAALSIDEKDFLGTIDRVLWHFDEPSPYFSALSHYYLAREAKKHLTVVLSGAGSREMFGGHLYYAKALSLEEGRLDLGNLPLELRHYQKGLKPAQIAAEFTSSAQMQLVDKLVPGNDDYRVNTAFHFENTDFPDFLSRMQYMDLKTHFVHRMNKEDKMNMAWGIEGRYPFLDYRLVSFALSLPPESKLKGDVGRWILKYLCERTFGKEFIERTEHVFYSPVEEWFASDKALLGFQRVRDTFGSLFNWQFIDEMVANYSLENREHSRRLWGLYGLERWLSIHFDQ